MSSRPVARRRNRYSGSSSAVAPGCPAPSRPGTSAAHPRPRRPAAAANDSSNSSSEAEQDDVGESAADDRGEEVLPHHPRVPTRDTLAGCRVFVPREAWPDEACDGEGWWGRVKRVVSETAKVEGPDGRGWRDLRF
eukprot:scaffold7646_cov172-Isochrysis_galbana.AAC.1